MMDIFDSSDRRKAEELQFLGFTRIGKMDGDTLLRFKKQSADLVRSTRSKYPKGELFNLINAHIDTKLASNAMVREFLVPEVQARLDDSAVDVLPVSHIIKPFGLKGGIWHQDSAVVNEQNDFSLNAWMPLIDSNRMNGCLWIFPGSHILQNFKRQFGHNPIREAFLEKLRPYMIPIEVKAGEILIFHRNLVHGSSRNWYPFSRIAAECLVTSRNAQFVNFHRDKNLHEGKIMEFMVPSSHFLKANPKEDFYSGEYSYILHDDESDEEIRDYLLKSIPDCLGQAAKFKRS